MKKNRLGIRLIQFIVLISALSISSGLLVYTDVYEHVESSIVEVLCLSCIKLEPYTSVDFVFDTVNSKPHPFFVLENLTYGPVFLMYSQDVCEACDIMQPVVQSIFNVSYGKEDDFSCRVSIKGCNVTYIYINMDHASQEKKESYFIYDKDNVRGVPMFTLITLGNDHGVVRPYYTSIYGTLNLPSSETRSMFIYSLLEQGINLYNQNREGYRVE